ncbi:MAG: hypothetical protein JW864_08080 [Spirochaetes bacterium]|nr:hypothetical protein [Spirochaetota bacterium]
MTNNNNTNENSVEQHEYTPSLKNQLGGKKYLVIAVISLIVIIIVSLIFAALSDSFRITAEPVKDALGWDVLRIDGNRNGKYVDFDHEAHKSIAGEGRESCAACHHLSKPYDGPSSCYQCHMDMNKSVSIFDHDYHIRLNIKNDSCRACHTTNKESVQDVVSCSSCHKDYDKDVKYYLKVRSYREAMHTQCIGCHKQEDESLGECAVCHGSGEN